MRIDVVKRSLDARRRDIVFQLTVGVHIDKIEEREAQFVPAYQDVSLAKPVVVVGAGPAGLYAALRLIERGFRPVLLERGENSRRKT